MSMLFGIRPQPETALETLPKTMEKLTATKTSRNSRKKDFVIEKGGDVIIPNGVTHSKKAISSKMLDLVAEKV